MSPEMVFRTQRVHLQLVMQNWPQLCPWFFVYILGRNHRIAPWTCTTTFENSNFSYFWCFALFFDEFVTNYVCKIIPPIAPAIYRSQKMTTSSRLSNRSEALPKMPMKATKKYEQNSAPSKQSKQTSFCCFGPLRVCEMMDVHIPKSSRIFHCFI